MFSFALQGEMCDLLLADEVFNFDFSLLRENQLVHKFSIHKLLCDVCWMKKNFSWLELTFSMELVKVLKQSDD